jgi:hypothetical protein
MSLRRKVCWSILFSLMLTVGVFAGEPGAGQVGTYRAATGGEAKGDARASALSAPSVAGGSAALKGAAKADLSAAKGGEPSDSQPGRVTSGSAAEFKAASAGPPVVKDRDPSGSLPTSSATGDSAVYTAGAGAEGSASKAVESTGPVGETKP